MEGELAEAQFAAVGAVAPFVEHLVGPGVEDAGREVARGDQFAAMPEASRDDEPERHAVGRRAAAVVEEVAVHAGDDAARAGFGVQLPRQLRDGRRAEETVAGLADAEANAEGGGTVERDHVHVARGGVAMQLDARDAGGDGRFGARPGGGGRLSGGGERGHGGERGGRDGVHAGHSTASSGLPFWRRTDRSGIPLARGRRASDSGRRRNIGRAWGKSSMGNRENQEKNKH